eukprot:TRINITY_DN168_c0_g2_i1.p1 TRINITY_DN168_c0_g2~~TRINITY_DN168_c0_g2_i1.p1  ORF type:complete len:1133 (+),score=299.67 TRINITY_DN168_c0_g2_i1:39-3437(+)
MEDFDESDLAFFEGGEDVKEETDVEEEDDDEVVVTKKRKRDKKDKKNKKKRKEQPKPKPKKRKAPIADSEDDDSAKEDGVKIEIGVKIENPDSDSDEIKSEISSDAVKIEIPEDNDRIKVIPAKELVLVSLRNGMPGKFFTPDEQATFRTTKTDVQQKKHLYTRNMILREWDKNPKNRVYLSQVRRLIDSAHIQAAHSVFSYCEELGLINYGVPKNKYPVIKNGRTAHVIGAGISGLLTAQQLVRAGFDVQVFEGGHAPGGRCKSITMSSKKQDESESDDEAENFTVPVGPPSRYDLPEMMTEREDEADNDDTRSQRSGVELLGINEALDTIGERSASIASIDSQERAAAGLARDPVEPPRAVVHNLLRQAGVSDWDDPEKKLASFFVFGHNGTHILNPEEEIGDAEAVLYPFIENEIPEGGTLGPVVDFIQKLEDEALRNKCMSIVNGWEEQAHAKIDSLGKNGQQFRVGNAYVLDVSWDKICDKLAKGLTIKYGEPVTDVAYTNDNVTITTEKKQQDPCDYCVVTVPLGVLKAKPGKEGNDGAITFTPGLGEEKLEALKHIGCGVKNTLVLAFDKPFWIEQKFVPEEGAEPARIQNMDFVLYKDANTQLRGVGARGSLHGLPHPHATISLSGDAATLAEEGGTQAVVDEAMAHFRRIFTAVEVPEPIDVRVSRWGKDALTRGSSPFLAPTTHPRHFESLAKPLGNNGEGPLFFAGDATDSTNYGLIIGAAGSALRASRQVVQFYKKNLKSGKIRKPIPTPADRFIELSMNGAAAKLGAGAPVARQVKSDDPGLQHSRGSSRNLAAKYAKTDVMPTMQRNLFNATVKPNDESTSKIGQSYMNVQAAKASAANQQSLVKLERQTELRWHEAKQLRQRELAKEVASRQSASMTAKKPDPRMYNASNAVDDALPTWYYQNPSKVENRGREFATSFYKSNTRQTKEQTEEAIKNSYILRLGQLIEKSIRKYAVPKIAKMEAAEIKIYATSTLNTTKKSLLSSILQRFQKAHETKVGRSFSTGDWSELPKLSQGGVISAIQTAIDSYFVRFVDPYKDAVIKILEWDPNCENPPEKLKDTAKSEITDVKSLATSFLAQPHGYDVAENLPSVEYTPGADEESRILSVAALAESEKGQQ